MASGLTEKDPVKCWNLLVEVLSYGHTIPYLYQKAPPTYFLTEGSGGWGYWDHSCAEYLLDDIQFALFDQKLPLVELHLKGIADGPVCDFWRFYFTRDGLVEVNSYYNDD